MNEFVYLLKVIDPENGKLIEYKTFNDPKRAIKYLLNKSEEDNCYYDHFIMRIGVSE